MIFCDVTSSQLSWCRYALGLSFSVSHAILIVCIMSFRTIKVYQSLWRQNELGFRAPRFLAQKYMRCGN